MGYRNVAEALEARKRALELENAELDAQLSHRNELDARKREVENELRQVNAQLHDAGSRTRLPLLQRITVARPCKANWDGMTGDDKRRFCKGCSKYVYNLSAMSSEEAEALV